MSPILTKKGGGVISGAGQILGGFMTVGQFQRRTMALKGGEMSFLERPGPGVALVFLHANGFNGQTYRRIFDQISPDIHLFAPDMRGHGHTTLPANPAELTSWTQYRDDMMAFVDGLSVTRNRPLVMAGHSMGGTTSVMVAHDCPGRVAHLFLMDPVVYPSPNFLMRYFIMPFLSRRNLAEGAKRRRWQYPDRDAVFKSYKGRGAFVTWPDDMLRDYIYGGTLPDEGSGIKLACAPAWEAANFSLSFNDVWRQFGEIMSPVTLFHATGLGATCPPDKAKMLQAQKPDMKRVQMDGASHFLPMEQPERMAQAINEICDGLKSQVLTVVK